MSDKKDLSEKELESVAGGASIRNTVSFTDATPSNAVSFSGGNFQTATAKTMVQTSSKKSGGVFSRILSVFRKKAAKNVTAGKIAVTDTDDKRFFA